MKKLMLFGMILLLAACQAESEPEAAVVPTVAEVVSGDEVEPADEEATEPPAAPRPAATELPEPGNTVVVEPTAPAPEVAPTEMPTEEVVEPVAETGFGMVDGTFYRGMSDAPVRLIDYSDFL